jgi:predicted DNA binding protein
MLGKNQRIRRQGIYVTSPSNHPRENVLIEATLSVKMPELWVCQITEKYNVEISGKVGGSGHKTIGWCLVEIKGKDDSLLDTVVTEIQNHPSVGTVKVQSRQAGKVTLMVDIRRCEACKALRLSKYFLTYPVEIKNGYMTWVMITDNNLTLGEICNRLEGLGCEVKIHKVVPFEEKKLLTERQEKVISVAFEKGYFDNPKRNDSHSIASELGITAATFSEIIRAAQRRILRERFREWQVTRKKIENSPIH